MADTFKGIITADGKKRQLPYGSVLETPVSDKTLEIEGAFADSKEVGERFAKVNETTDSLKEDISTKITKFYASNQGEAHITDSDNGKIQDMMIYGKSSQDGTPTPENPVEIKSVVNPTIKLLGSNILKMMDGEYQNGGVTVTVSNGVVKLKGTANRYLDIPLTANSKIAFKKGTKIIFSPNNVKGIENQKGSYLDFTNNNTVGFSITSNNINIPYIIKERDTEYGFALFIRCHAGITYDEIWKPQVSIGETITPFKPYTEQIITLPITLNAIPVSKDGNITINGQQYVADYVDVERGKLVRMVGVTNQDTFFISKWSTGSIVIYSEISNVGTDDAIVTISSEFSADWSAGDEIHHFTQPTGQTLVMVLPKTITTVEQGEEIRAKGFKFYYILATPIEIDLTEEENAALKELATYYPVTNISINSEQIDGYTIFNYPISMANGWNYVKQQLNDNRDYIYDMDSRAQDIDTQAAEAYVNSEYAVALTELEV